MIKGAFQHPRTPAPDLGQHTAEIVGEFGIDRTTLEAWAKDGVIGLEK